MEIRNVNVNVIRNSCSDSDRGFLEGTLTLSELVCPRDPNYTLVSTSKLSAVNKEIPCYTKHTAHFLALAPNLKGTLCSLQCLP